MSKKGFTIIELVFAIVIMGIIGSFSMNAIIDAYKTHLLSSRALTLVTQNQVALKIITNHLSNAIYGSVRAYGSNGAPIDLNRLNKDTQYSVLEWLDKEQDGFNSFGAPAWSGFCDLNASTFNTLATPGSKLSDKRLLLNHYLGSNRAAIRFIGTDNFYKSGNVNSSSCLYSANGCMFGVNTIDNEHLQFASGDRTAGMMIYSEFYQLSTTAFAIVSTNQHTVGVNKKSAWDLELHYGYQPWAGESYSGASKSLLAKDVSYFAFRQEFNSIKLRLCSLKINLDGEAFEQCAEEVVTQ